MRQPRLPGTAQWKCLSRARKEGECGRVLPKYRLRYKVLARARFHTYRDSDGAEHASGTPVVDLERVTRELRRQGYSLPPLEVLLVRFEIGIHLEKPAECRN